MANRNQYLKAAGMGLMGYAKHDTENRKIDIEQQRADTLARIEASKLELGREDLDIKRKELAINQAQEERRLTNMEVVTDQGQQKIDQTGELRREEMGLTEKLGIMGDTTANRRINVTEALGQEQNSLTGLGLNLKRELGDQRFAISNRDISMRRMLGLGQLDVAEEGNRIREEKGIMDNETALTGIASRETINTANLAQDDRRLGAQKDQWGTMNKAQLGEAQDKFVTKMQEDIDALLEPGDMDMIEHAKQVDALLKASAPTEFGTGMKPEEVQDALKELDKVYMDKRMSEFNPGTKEEPNPDYVEAKREAREYTNKIVRLLKAGRKQGTTRWGTDFGDALSGYLTLGDDAAFLYGDPMRTMDGVEDPLMPYTPAPRRPGHRAYPPPPGEATNVPFQGLFRGDDVWRE